MGHSQSLFFFIFVFLIQLLQQLRVNKFANDWIRTADLLCRKRPLYQLRHNHCPELVHELSLSLSLSSLIVCSKMSKNAFNTKFPSVKNVSLSPNERFLSCRWLAYFSICIHFQKENYFNLKKLHLSTLFGLEMD